MITEAEINYSYGSPGQKAASHNKGGYSLVELLVVAGIMGVLILAFATMFANQLKMTNYIDFKFDTNNFLYVMKTNLTMGDSCEDSFVSSGTNINQVVVPQLVDVSGEVLVAHGQDWGSLTIESISTENNNVPVGGGTGIIDLIFTIKSQKQVLGNNILVRKLPLKVEADAGGVILNCGGGALVSEDCYTREGTTSTTFAGEEEVACDNPGEMVSVLCTGSCELRPNSVYIVDIHDDGGGSTSSSAQVRCCPTE